MLETVGVTGEGRGRGAGTQAHKIQAIFHRTRGTTGITIRGRVYKTTTPQMSIVSGEYEKILLYIFMISYEWNTRCGYHGNKTSPWLITL